MNDELQHYGVKGMKWGVRRNHNAVNKDYSDKQRKHDRAFYGKGGEKRINKRLNEGHGLRGARHYEAERKERNKKLAKKAKRGAKAIGTVLQVAGSIYAIDMAYTGGAVTRATTKAGKAAVKSALSKVGDQMFDYSILDATGKVLRRYN
jgi:hypothetical protein